VGFPPPGAGNTLTPPGTPPCCAGGLTPEEYGGGLPKFETGIGTSLLPCE
jgi:hypothetical protein